jgi:hypothetical protein
MDMDIYNKINIEDILYIYIRECMEVFVAITIIRIALEKPLEIFDTIQVSFLIGILTTGLEFYDKDFKKSIKQGMNAFAGTQIVSKFINK